MKFIDPIDLLASSSFSRASAASFYTLAGLVGFAPAGEPRLSYPPEVRIYAPAGWLTGPMLLLPTMPLPGVAILPPGAPQFLAEAASTNLMLQSQDITTWTAAEATVTANAAVAPDGTTSADLVAPSATDTVAHQISKAASASVAPGETVGASLFVRAAGLGKVRLRVATAGEAAGFEVTVDLANANLPSAGQFGAGASIMQARIVRLASDWIRIELEGAVAGEGDFGLYLTLGDGLNSFAGVTDKGVEVWGAQLEAGGVSSYIPTTTTAAVRAADLGKPRVVSSIPVTEPVYNAATTYAKNVAVRGDTAATSGTLYVSVASGNNGHALTDAAWWIEAGPINRLRMLDETLGTISTAADAITVVINPDQRVTGLALLAIDAAQARVTMTDPVEGVIYDRTVSLVDNSAVATPWDYFFQPIRRKTYDIFLDLPPYADIQVAVTLSDPGFAVACGGLSIGALQDIGDTRWGVGLSFISASTIQRDGFNRVTVKKRALSRKANVEVIVKPSMVDYLYDLFGQLDSRLVVWIASDQYRSMILYAYYKDFSLVVPYALPLYTLQLEAA
ncbi:hypothetical protein [Phenylobacterium sp.]|uniref:phage head spike fiber domain-containing protein n=1 Tax=Phenylobacterium sp. TaxID=1871053 RepID=UPI0035B15F2E